MKKKNYEINWTEVKKKNAHTKRVNIVNLYVSCAET